MALDALRVTTGSRSLLFRHTTARSSAARTSAASDSSNGSAASSTISTTSAPSAARSARSTPIRSMGSSVSRWPAVSESSATTPPMLIRSVSTSRVVPGMSVTMARSWFSSAFISEDLPTLGRPASTMDAPSRSIRACRASHRARMSATMSADVPRQLIGGGLLLDLVREVRGGLDQRQHAGQAVRDPPHEARHAALQLPHGRPRRRLAVRADQLHHRLGPRQVDAPVHEGPAGEFPGLGHPRAQRQRPAQHRPGAHAAAVAVDLRHVLPGVGAGRAHQHGHHLVQRPAVRVHGPAVHQPMGRKAFPRLRGNEQRFNMSPARRR